MESMIHVITLGVEDINRSLHFYRDGLGFKTTVKEDDPAVVFFQLQGTVLALFPKDALAKDVHSALVPSKEGFNGTTLAQVVRSKERVVEVLELAEKAGGKIVKVAQDAFWGGYHGYFADPDNYYWEVAYWENWQFKPDGSLRVDNV